MDEILLYLSLKYSGDWMAIYNSLQNKEKVTLEEIKKVYDQIDCKYTTLLDDKYPEGLKQIYKPPFGIFSYGNYDLLTKNNIITVFADDIDNNLDYLKTIKDNNGYVLWVNLSNKDTLNVLSKSKDNNIFWLPYLHKNNKLNMHLLEDEQIVNNNLFFSELWTENDKIDIAGQAPERMYLGISHKVLVLNKLSSKQLIALASYGMNEDINIVFKKELFDDKIKKLFTKCKVSLIDNSNEILTYFIDK